MSTAEVQNPSNHTSTGQENALVNQKDVEIDKKQNLGSENICNPQTENQKVSTATIFQQNNQQRKSFNIFNQKPAEQQKPSIFTQHKKSVNLFNVSTVPQTVNSNIFKSDSKPLIRTADDDEEKSVSNASSGAVNKAQSEFKSCPEKLEMKFIYENPWTVVKRYNLRKFKNGANGSKEHIYLTFQKNQQCPEKTHIFVRARQTKVLLFQGFGIKNITNKISSFMGKEQNLKFCVIKPNKKENEEDLRPQFSKEELKLQFENVEDANDFKQFVMQEYGESAEKIEVQTSE